MMLITTEGGRNVAKFGESSDLVKCSFCGKTQKEVAKLIAGPGSYICNECIQLCNDIIHEELDEEFDEEFDGSETTAVSLLDDHVRRREAHRILTERLGRRPSWDGPRNEPLKPGAAPGPSSHLSAPPRRPAQQAWPVRFKTSRVNSPGSPGAWQPWQTRPEGTKVLSRDRLLAHLGGARDHAIKQEGFGAGKADREEQRDAFGRRWHHLAGADRSERHEPLLVGGPDEDVGRW